MIGFIFSLQTNGDTSEYNSALARPITASAKTLDNSIAPWLSQGPYQSSWKRLIIKRK